MGRHPGDILLTTDTTHLSLHDLLDPRLSPPMGESADQAVFAVSMGLACTRTKPESRPTMRFVAQQLSARINQQPTN